MQALLYFEADSPPLDQFPCAVVGEHGWVPTITGIGGDHVVVETSLPYRNVLTAPSTT